MKYFYYLYIGTISKKETKHPNIFSEKK